MSHQSKIPNSIFRCRSCDSKSTLVSIIKSDFPLYIWPLPKSKKTKLADINVHLCNDCGYMQLQNIDNQTISEIYRDEAFNIVNESQNINRYKTLTSNDNSTFNNTKVLEVGGGINPFIQNLPKSAKKWVADFDIDKKILPVLNGIFIGDFVEIDIDQNNFDYIFMFHILEHFNNPSLALQKTRKLLNSNGRLVIEVPNFAFVAKHMPYYALFHMHISMFTKESLLSIMMRHGFNCTNFFTSNDVLFAEFSLGDYKTSKNLKNISLRYLNELQSITNKSSLTLQNYFKKLSDCKIAIFGAGGSTTLFLYNYPFLIEKISYAMDNDKNKIGRYLCNGKISIISPANTNEKIDYVIVLEENHIQLIENNNVILINIRKILK